MGPWWQPTPVDRAESGHSGKTNSVVDNAVEFAVAQALCGCITHVSGLGIEVAPDDRVSAVVQPQTES
jgi:hypothetical protein